ncbi:MAG: carboxypeptidase regulatory-like domain-containing protein [Candidatus Hodarchaeales archaeon]
MKHKFRNYTCHQVNLLLILLIIVAFLHSTPASFQQKEFNFSSVPKLDSGYVNELIIPSLPLANASYVGTSTGAHAGRAVAKAGDVNNDGYADFLIGEPNDDYGGADAGQAYLILGKSTGWAQGLSLSSVSASFVGENADDNAGGTIAGVGDVNNDSYDDILIGARDNSFGGGGAGQVYLILGRPTGKWAMRMSLTDANASFVGENSGDFAGDSIAGAGDFNNDSYDDFLIGSISSEGGTNAGQTYLFFGRPTQNWYYRTSLADANASFLGEHPEDYSGRAVAGAGDVNNDGFDDILIGASHNNEIGVDAGQSYLILGRTAATLSVDMSLETVSNASYLGLRPYDYSGNAVAGAGDVNNDGFDDILIGAYFSNTTGTGAGEVFLILGKSSGWQMDTSLANVDASFAGEYQNDEAGWAVSGAGDVNNDSYADFMIGARWNDAAGSQSGKFYLFLGKSTINWGINTSLLLANMSFSGENAGDEAGGALAGVGDVNKDGYADLLIGAYANDASGADAGKVYLLLPRVEVHDISPPTIELLSPEVNGSGIGLGEYIVLDINDNTLVDTVLYQWDNDPFNISATIGKQINITQTPIDYGDHILRVYTNDTSNNWNTSTYLFTVGSIISGQISDAFTGSPISGASILLVNDSTSQVIQATISNSTGHYRFAGLGIGEYGINVSAPGMYPSDVSGLNIAGEGIDLIMDFDLLESESPTITLITPINGSTIPQNTKIQLDIRDNFQLYQIHHHWDNAATNTSLVVYGNSTYLYNLTDLPSALGIHTLHVYVEDAGISTAHSRFQFNVSEASDTDPPVITLSGIFVDEIYNGVITVTCNIYDESPLFWTGIWIYDQYYNQLSYNTEYNLTLEPVSATIWTFTVDFNTTVLANGLASISVEVQDILGNSETVSITFYIENLPPPPMPDITLFGIDNGTTYGEVVLVTTTITHTSPLATITFWVRNTSGQYLYWHSESNITLINVTSTSWTFTISIDTTLLANGEYTVGVEVKDLLGVHNKQIVEIEISNLKATSTESSTSTTTTTQGISPGFSYFWTIGFLIFLCLTKHRGFFKRNRK